MARQPRVTVRNVVASFPNLAEARAVEEGGKAKYSCAFILREGQEDQVKALKVALAKALVDKFGKTTAKTLLKKPGALTLRTDPDDIAEKQKKHGYPEDTIAFFNARSNNKPGVVNMVPDPNNGDRPTVIDPGEVYAGAIVNVTVDPYGYNNSGNRGATFGLGNVQFVKDGERLDGRGRAQDEFDSDEDFAAAIDALDDDDFDEDEEDLEPAEDEDDDISDLIG